MSRIPTRAEYEEREFRSAMAREAEVSAAPLSERQEARTEFGEALRDPALISQRIGWLINGSYGFGEMKRATQILSRGPRMNKRAALTQLIAVYEWRCPAVFAVQAWKGLSAAQKAALDNAIDAAIKTATETEE